MVVGRNDVPYTAATTWEHDAIGASRRAVALGPIGLVRMDRLATASVQQAKADHIASSAPKANSPVPIHCQGSVSRSSSRRALSSRSLVELIDVGAHLIYALVSGRQTLLHLGEALAGLAVHGGEVGL